MSDLLADAAIQQLNLGYDPLQDRLLLRLGLEDQTEITIWLTRRVVKALWPMLQGLSIAPLTAGDALETQKSLDHFASSARNNAQKMDFSEAYQLNRVARTAEPLLPSECRILSVDHSPSALELQSRDGNTVRIPLSVELTNALGNMLQLATREAAWDLSLVPSMAVMNVTAAQSLLH